MLEWLLQYTRKYEYKLSADLLLNKDEECQIRYILALKVDRKKILNIYEDEFLSLSFLPGTSSALVIAVTGVGLNVGGKQTEEFVKSASSNHKRNILFVIDKKRSWFTQPRVIENICKYTLYLMGYIGTATVTTLGHSMGGYGAILLSKYLPVNNVVAFAPQYSMNRCVVFERRWKEYRKFILRPAVSGLNEALVDDSQYFILFGNDRRDIRHKNKFKIAANVHLFSIPRGGHNPAAVLKEINILNMVLDSAIEGNAFKVDELLKNVDATKLA